MNALLHRLSAYDYCVSLLAVLIQITPMPKKSTTLLLQKYGYITVHEILLASLDDIGFDHWFILVETNFRPEKQFYFFKI